LCVAAGAHDPDGSSAAAKRNRQGVVVGLVKQLDGLDDQHQGQSPAANDDSTGTTEASDKPLSAAIDARDQCVASLGVRSSVATITASI
jgi:hypothetical protein